MPDAWWRGELDARLPGGESALDLRARFLPAVERIVGDGDGDVVLAAPWLTSDRRQRRMA